jgi:putative tryptophan/tyrosine transport system substrate-binding protein
MRILVLLITLALMNALPALGADVLILQSSRSAGYADALRGFHAACGMSHRTLVMSDYAEVDVERIVKEERPRLVLAVGDKALAAAAKIRELPVVALLSFSLNLQKNWADNFGGISMAAAPEQYLALFAYLGLKNVGILYDPAKTGRYLKRIVHDAQQLGLNLFVVPVDATGGIQDDLEKLRGKVDALWVLPDSTVATGGNMEAFRVFSVAVNVPVVTFSRQYLNMGAAASLDLDYYDVGQQAAEMVASMLSGEARKVPTLYPRKTHVHANGQLICRLGKQLTGFTRQ